MSKEKVLSIDSGAKMVRAGNQYFVSLSSGLNTDAYPSGKPAWIEALDILDSSAKAVSDENPARKAPHKVRLARVRN